MAVKRSEALRLSGRVGRRCRLGGACGAAPGVRARMPSGRRGAPCRRSAGFLREEPEHRRREAPSPPRRQLLPTRPPNRWRTGESDRLQAQARNSQRSTSFAGSPPTAAKSSSRSSAGDRPAVAYATSGSISTASAAPSGSRPNPARAMRQSSTARSRSGRPPNRAARPARGTSRRSASARRASGRRPARQASARAAGSSSRPRQSAPSPGAIGSGPASAPRTSMVALEAHLGEQRRQVGLPVGQRRALALEPLVQEPPERDPVARRSIDARRAPGRTSARRAPIRRSRGSGSRG